MTGAGTDTVTGAATDTTTDVAALEELFGDAADPGNPVGTAALLDADERRELSAEAQRRLERFGLNAHIVPAELGGRLVRLDQTVGLLRAVYRRDPALGLGYGVGSLLAGVNVWTGGRTEQRAELARLLLAGGRAGCAYHELAHGNDLGRAELTALPAAGGGLVLNGRKEVIANLSRADAVVLFARTGADTAAGPAPGGRGHSQLLLDPATLPAAHVRWQGRYRTAGMRGVELGGVVFEDCPVPADSVVGSPGRGLEIALRSFQLSRVVLPGMTLGLLDSALRSAMHCATTRQLYGGTVADLALSRSLLAESFADLLLADAFSTVAARALHTDTGQGESYAAAVKALVPGILMSAVQRLSGLLGSQFYLRRGEHALFQKLLRDSLPSGFGHASRASCLATLIPQLPLAARRSWTAPAAPPLDERAFRLRDALPALDFDALAVTAAGRDPLACSLREGFDLPASGAPHGLAQAVRARRAELADLAERCPSGSSRRLGPAASADDFALALRWAGLLAAVACLGVWRYNRDEPGAGLGDPVWAAAALHRLDAHLGRHRDPLPAALADPLYAELLARHRARLTFDLARHPTLA